MARPRKPGRIPQETAFTRTITFFTLNVIMFNADTHSTETHSFDDCYGNAERLAHEKAKELPGKYVACFTDNEHTVKTWVTISEYLTIAHRAELGEPPVEETPTENEERKDNE